MERAMRIPPYAIPIALMLAAAACNPIAEYTESEAPKRLVVDSSTFQFGIRFLPASSGLAAAEAARVRGLAATGEIARSDRVLIAAGGGPGLSAARVGAVSAELLRYGIVTSPVYVAGIAPNGAVIEVVRHQVTLPPCPDWSKSPASDFTNTPHSNFGCATLSNLGRMVASPTDLVRGRPLGLAPATPAIGAVDRYLSEKVPPAPPSDSVISAPVIPPPGAAAAGAGAGGGPPTTPNH